MTIYEKYNAIDEFLISLSCFMFSYNNKDNMKLLIVPFNDISYLLANSVVK